MRCKTRRRRGSFHGRRRRRSSPSPVSRTFTSPRISTHSTTRRVSLEQLFTPLFAVEYSFNMAPKHFLKLKQKKEISRKDFCPFLFDCLHVCWLHLCVCVWGCYQNIPSLLCVRVCVCVCRSTVLQIRTRPSRYTSLILLAGAGR